MYRMPIYYIPKKEFMVVKDSELIPYLQIASRAMAAILSIAFLTGARIAEIILLRKKSIVIDYENDEIRFLIPTLKRSDMALRMLVFSISKDPFIIKHIIPYVEKKKNEESRLFIKTKRSYQSYLLGLNKRLYGNDIKKYITFHYLRHSAITHIARDLKASSYEIQSFTGHKSSAFEDYFIIEAPIRFKGQMSHSSS